jgi:hypothetical protein
MKVITETRLVYLYFISTFLLLKYFIKFHVVFKSFMNNLFDYSSIFYSGYFFLINFNKRKQYNKPDQFRSTDYWADDALGTNSQPAEVSRLVYLYLISTFLLLKYFIKFHVVFKSFINNLFDYSSIFYSGYIFLIVHDFVI